MTKQVNLTINGKQVTVPDGTLIADAAKMIGIDIPVFCHHPKLEPVGMCRMCLVEVGRPMLDRATGQVVMENGQPKIQFMPKLETACTNRVSEGMVVMTTTDKALDGQKGTVEFLLTSHPLDCPVCDKGGECPLQNLTMAFGPGKSRFIYDEKLRFEKQVPVGDGWIASRIIPSSSPASSSARGRRSRRACWFPCRRSPSRRRHP
jgi:NADH-quinone oxidoreductase subunit G